MSHPLDGCWAKIERANHNINRLNQLTTNFVSLHSHDFRTEINADKTEHIYRVFGPPPPPLNFAVRTGEIVNHLRASLDHLIWALVLKRHKSPTFKVQFPVCLTAAKYEKAIEGGIIKGVSGSAQAIIERLQPYHATKPAEDALAILHDLNNIDKHKLLLVVSCYAYVPDTISFSGDRAEHHEIKFVPENWSRRSIRAEESGAELFRVRFTRPINVSMYANVTQQIAFEKFGVRNHEPLIEGLSSLRDAVVKALKLFNGEF